MKELKKLLIAFTTLLLLSLSVKSIAQRPSAILVMLKTETNRISALEKSGQTGPASQLRGEAEIIRQKTINDFRDHFSYCPVYYFIDTNLQLIKEKKFEGVLFDKDKNIYTIQPINTDDTTFFIVSYGLAMSNIKEKANGEQEYLSNRESMRQLKGLNVLDHHFKIMEKCRTCFINRREPKKHLNNEYEFVSEDFDLGYMRVAGSLAHAISGSSVLIITNDKKP